MGVWQEGEYFKSMRLISFVWQIWGAKPQARESIVRLSSSSLPPLSPSPPFSLPTSNFARNLRYCCTDRTYGFKVLICARYIFFNIQLFTQLSRWRFDKGISSYHPGHEENDPCYSPPPLSPFLTWLPLFLLLRRFALKSSFIVRSMQSRCSSTRLRVLTKSHKSLSPLRVSPLVNHIASIRAVIPSHSRHRLLRNFLTIATENIQRTNQQAARDIFSM